MNLPRQVLHRLLAAALALAAAGVSAQSLPAAATPAPAATASVAVLSTGPADDAVLVRGPAGTVTVQQFQAAVEYLVPPAQRTEFYANPRSIENLAMSIYGRQALEAEARQQGFDRQSITQQVMAVAAQQALTDQWLRRQLEQRLPTEQQVEQYARSVHQAKPGDAPKQVVRLRLRHIMLAVTLGLPDEQARAKAESLLAELRGGADFQALARRDSTDRVSAARGGEMQPLFPGSTPTAFESAALALDKPGQISEVVKSGNGYHIIQLIEQRTVDSFEREREALMAQARARLESQARMEIWNKAQAGASVEGATVQSLTRVPEIK